MLTDIERTKELTRELKRKRYFSLVVIGNFSMAGYLRRHPEFCALQLTSNSQDCIRHFSHTFSVNPKLFAENGRTDEVNV